MDSRRQNVVEDGQWQVGDWTVAKVVREKEGTAVELRRGGVKSVRGAERGKRGAQTGRFAQHRLSDREQAHLQGLEKLLVGGFENLVAAFDRSDERLHQRQLAADDFQLPVLSRQPDWFEQGPITIVRLHAVDDGLRVQIHKTGQGERQ